MSPRGVRFIIIFSRILWLWIAMRRILLFLFSHRFLALARWDFYFLRLRARNAVLRQKAWLDKALAAATRPFYLNLGSGPRGLDSPNWLNIDGYPDKNVHFLVDFGRTLPFPDRTFDGVFCEHVLEHFTLEDGEQLARDVFRCMRPGAIWRIIVPDAERIMRAYFDQPKDLVARRGGTAMEAVNSYFRQRYEHHFLYDWESMRQMLMRAGFSDVVRCKSHIGRNRDLVLDDDKYAWESLYVEAVKGDATPPA
jgi:predicted SAM-dependent methyltransferase